MLRQCLVFILCAWGALIFTAPPASGQDLTRPGPILATYRDFGWMGRDGHVLTVCQNGQVTLELYGNRYHGRDKGVGIYTGLARPDILAGLKQAMADRRFADFKGGDMFIPEGLVFSLGDGETEKLFGTTMDGPVEADDFILGIIDALRDIRELLLLETPRLGIKVELAECFLSEADDKIFCRVRLNNCGLTKYRLCFSKDASVNPSTLCVSIGQQDAENTPYHQTSLGRPQQFTPSLNPEKSLVLEPGQSLFIDYAITTDKLPSASPISMVWLEGVFSVLPLSDNPPFSSQQIWDYSLARIIEPPLELQR